MYFLTFLFTFIIAVLFKIYRWGTSTFHTFTEQGIPGPKPFPIMGNMWKIWTKTMLEYDDKLVKTYGRTFGYFDGITPNLWTTDPDIIKAVFIKDFDHFVNRRDLQIPVKVLRKMLTSIRDQEWKDVRSSITPTFTTGKIKKMSFLIKTCVDKMTTKMLCQASNEGKIDAKTNFSAFTMDVIARCAFGMKIDNLGEKDDIFMKNAQGVLNSPVYKTPFILIPTMYPQLLKLLSERIFYTKENHFFVELLSNVVKERAKSDVKYNDFVEIATEAISEYTKEVNGENVPMWSREEVEEIVTGQSFIFMLAGFDTTATTLTNACFLLARNQDVQNKLYEEIAAKSEKFNEVSHEMIQEMPYLEQVIYEVLRLYPPLNRTERECNQDITIKGIHIKQGMMVTVPAFPLHRLEEFYPDPETFNPERWSPENKKNLNPYVFMPFGMGPRNCVGMRFALEEMKMALCSVVKQIRFFPVAETPEKLQFDFGFSPIIQPIGITVGIELRGGV